MRVGRPARNRQNWDAFIGGMHNISVIKAKKVLEALPLKSIKTALDIGGGPGTYSIELAKKGIEVTPFDFADTLEIEEIAPNRYQKCGCQTTC